jgi:pyridoxamine 5'-phosphate oxidase
MPESPPAGPFQSFPDVPLRRADLRADPLAQLAAWLAEAEAAGEADPRAMSLATIAASGGPSCRIVSVKDVTDEGMVFTSATAAPKVRELAADPRAAAILYWPTLGRQVRASGAVTRLAAEVAERFYAARSRAARLALHGLPPGTVVANRAALESRHRELEARFAGSEVPIGAWAAFTLQPETVEFWQGRTNRLHDRFRYVRDAGGWRIDRLAP